MYAYTTSAVQVAVLRVFVRCDALLPNLFVGNITRESATNALDTGIAADQVVAFLRQHAHPRAAAKTPTVPPARASQPQQNARLLMAACPLQRPAHTVSHSYHTLSASPHTGRHRPDPAVGAGAEAAAGEECNAV